MKKVCTFATDTINIIKLRKEKHYEESIIGYGSRYSSYCYLLLQQEG